jgi:RNA 2',3'-cyclic 3'-phosphodiesterase
VPPSRPGQQRDDARLFIALWPTARVRTALHDWQQAWTWPKGAARVAPGKLHLTLHFLGAVDAARSADLEAALVPPQRGFDLRFGRAAVWRSGVAVAEADGVPDALAELHATLGETLHRLGLPVEARGFRPHVTLARHALGAVPPKSELALRWRVHGYALMQSLHGVYLERRRFG